MTKTRVQPARRPVLVLAALFAFGAGGLLGMAWAQDTGPVPQITEAQMVNPVQTRLLLQQISALAPQRPGVTDIYVIGLAGWAEQDVFLKELEGALASLEKVLPLNGGTIRLINHIDTVRRAPLASRQNFAGAVRAVGRVIDKDEDVLILFMTSHGAKTGMHLQLPGISVQLPPQEVAAVLKAEGIRNRVVIVSACFAGIFLKPLANDNTIVMTAADEKNTSFGCASDREWTYFGDAFFNQSLKPGKDFSGAFGEAKKLIKAWETKGRLRPSNPQGHFGAALVQKLEPLFAAKRQAQN